MRTTVLAALAATALATGFASAQTAAPPAATSAAGTTSFMTVLGADQMRGSKLIGLDIYGSDNAKIGDIDELILDKDGKVQAVVVGVGGFLGIGTKDVAFAYNQLTFVSEPRTTAAAPSAGVSAPSTPAGPATTGSTSTATSAAATADDDGVPDRANVKMTKADLQAAPEFRYSGKAAAAATNPPASNTMPPTVTTSRPATPQ